MKRVICCPQSNLPSNLDTESIYFILYSSSSGMPGVGHIAPELLCEIRRNGLTPSIETMDFLTFSLSVSAADKAIPRSDSADGWTREIELHVYLQAPAMWEEMKRKTEFTLRFLTGDFWSLHFHESSTINIPRPRKMNILSPGDSVCLLSGGMDSLIGAIDLTSIGRRPYFISQTVKGSGFSQRNFAAALMDDQRHCQWSGVISCPAPTEQSTRSRSIVFFAFALLVSSALRNTVEDPVEIFVPENGFISLNIPLDPLRVGSLSTKTTHPVYLAGLQDLWDGLGICTQLIQPYRFKTKGEMLKNCLNKEMLTSLVKDSVSCGKYSRHTLTHCGVCVPCLVRRAAFLAAGMEDATRKGYCLGAIAHADSRDVSAVADAYLQYQANGIESLIYGNLSFTSRAERFQYQSVFQRGLEELGELLKSQGVI